VLTVKTTRKPYGQIITIRDTLRDYETCADLNTDPRTHLEELARECRNKARRASEMAAFLAEAAATMEAQK
jgi:myo-inositol catabolism protein IolC